MSDNRTSAERINLKKTWAMQSAAGFGAAIALAIGLSAMPSTGSAQTPFLGPLTRPTCEPGDRTETGVDGQLTIAERQSGASKSLYNCNLQVVGQYQDQGAGHQLMWHNHCAYYTTPGFSAGGEEPDVPPLIHNGGVQILDVSDQAHPKWVGHLMDPLYAWEAAYVSQVQGLLVEAESWTGSGPQPAITIYDLEKDCEHPEMLFSGMFNATWAAHAANISPDGRTFYITGTETGESGRHHLIAIDITDPSNPKQILDWNFPNGQAGFNLHRINLNQQAMNGRAAGTILFVGQGNSPTSPGVFAPGDANQNGLVILDVSDVQNRASNPSVKVISTFFWVNGRTAIEPYAAMIGGVPFVAAGDEDGAGPGSYPAAAISACAAGLPPHGFYRLIDLSDLASPKLAANLMIGVDDPANCAQTQNDIISSAGGYGYSTHDCTFDNPDDAKLLACSAHQAGIRVFDIHNPYAPQEIAYFKGPAPPDPNQQDPGSLLTTAQGVTPPIDFAWSKAHSRFVWRKKQLYLWVTSSHGTFYTLKFEPTVMQNILALKPVPVPGNNMPD